MIEKTPVNNEDAISISNTISLENQSNCSRNDMDAEIDSTNSHTCSSHYSCDESADTRQNLLYLGDANEHVNTKRKTRFKCCTILSFLIGSILLAVGLITIAVPIYNYVLRIRLNMDPGLPPYEQWVKPAPEVRLNVYIFTIERENAEAFLNGTDQILRFKEIGPIVYREYLEHQNVVFHENSTMSYTAARRVEYLEDENEPGILNKTIFVPNFVILGTASSLNDASFVTKIGFKLLLRTSLDSLFMNITVYQYLWEYKSDLLQKVRSFAPFLVPTENSGALHTIYVNFNDRYNVRIGPKYRRNDFFTITSVNGDSVVPGFNTKYGDCNASIVGSSEGALYKTELTEKSVLWYWRKALCRQVPLYFEKKVQKGPFLANKYVLRENVFDRSEDLDDDCYKGFNEVLPDGISDLSKCFYNMPFAASNPHFFGRYPNVLTKKITGFTPDKEKHQSFIIVEPTLGVPIDQSARSQHNVIMPKLRGFNEQIERFSDMVLPTFWLSYHQKELTPHLSNLLVFTLHILPILQYFITAFLILVGGGLICLGNYKLQHNSTTKTNKKRKPAASRYDQNCKLNEPILDSILHGNSKLPLDHTDRLLTEIIEIKS